MKDLTLFPSKIKTSLRVRNRDLNWIRENLDTMEHNMILSKENNGYYLCITIDKQVINKQPKHNIVSLDPGVRTFQTFYSPGGVCGKIGNGFSNKFIDVLGKIDQLQGIQANSKLRKKLNNKMNLLRTKVRNTVDDLHRKASSFLCKNFNVILLPEFNVKQMVRREGRNISKTTTRSMLTLSHYRFKQRLLFTAQKYNREVIICRENWTSKTCGRCGEIDMELGSKEEYNCNHCGHSLDRDLNAARNIYLRQLTVMLNDK